MLYLLAAVGAIAVAVLLWRSFGSERLGVPSRGPSGSVSAPDDDPDFLRELDEQNRRKTEEDGK
ncbi:hypothetical protein EV191_105187 [Tamaricihabitans halophyticus]|uniref:Uncharacterized protein n=1 Tax=Tamaricihabitans halophyticus TaxID=1262583 RepID=A0A4R2QV26_9PSEU|nr:hypothetical protein [Tamaricihabitans halophyticus]TCP53124.1 hypothetical protein EV191_105187 [Tamaricihabitans halophyticus]